MKKEGHLLMRLEFKSTGTTHVPASYTRYTPGQIIWANVVYDNAPGTVEERGFVVLHDHRDRDSEMMIVLPATGEDAEHTPYDVFLSSWRTAGFQRPTWNPSRPAPNDTQESTHQNGEILVC